MRFSDVMKWALLMWLAAVILAAGQGTRMKSSLVKVLHPVAGRPMPTVSAMRNRCAPAVLARAAKETRNPGSARVASWAPTVMRSK